MTTPAKDLFKAETGTLWETMMAHSGGVGYRIPAYQRQYSWDIENLDRLLGDCLGSFARLCKSAEPRTEHTYLGSIILTARQAETAFPEDSFDVIDGQQRLTALTLICCALFQALADHRAVVDSIGAPTKEWLESEIDSCQLALHESAVGRANTLGGYVPFPKLVRAIDVRSASPTQSQYRSPIAELLYHFNQAVNSSDDPTARDSFLQTLSESAIKTHFTHIVDQLRTSLIEPIDISDDEDGVDTVIRSDFALTGCQSLFSHIDARPSDERTVCVDTITQSVATASLIRLLLFGSYVTRHVLLTRIETQSEEDAFVIFDALNTTGQPLTALETLKPLVTRFEEETASSYFGSESESYWESMEELLSEENPKPADLQQEVKELVTSFALYLNGQKLGSNLVDQRRYMRDGFEEARTESGQAARALVKALGDLATFRHEYWARDKIGVINLAQWDKQDVDELKLCLRFAVDMRTTLVIPIIARYWAAHVSDSTNTDFLTAAKAVVAFLALRRAATSSTAGIDSCFRDVMRKKAAGEFDPLCVGVGAKNELMPVAMLRSELRRMLAVPRIGVHDKASWIAKVKDRELGADAPKPLCRFLSLAAAHHARGVGEESCLLTREDVNPGSDIEYLTFGKWIDSGYSTVEHVAPQSVPDEGWSAGIYSDPSARHRLGNLVLLPAKENQTIGNSTWAKKRLFYRALASESVSGKEAIIDEAKTKGLSFGSKAEKVIRDQGRLHLLDHIVGVEEWTEEIIEQRTDNILGLAWDEFADWLYAE